MTVVGVTPAIAASAGSLGRFLAAADPVANATISEQFNAAGLGALAVAAAPAAAAPVPAALTTVFPAASVPAAAPAAFPAAAVPAVAPTAFPAAAPASVSRSVLVDESVGRSSAVEGLQSLDERKIRALLDLAIVSLREMVEQFSPLKAKIRGQIRIANRLKVGSEVLTTVLSSGVVGSVTLGGGPVTSTVLGLLALLASILTLSVARILGGDPKVVEEFGEISAKAEAAIQLSRRLTVYQNQPQLFDDIEKRLIEADEIKEYLMTKIQIWGLKL